MTVINDPELAKHWLKMGKLLAYPTESVWGIGCDAFNEQAVHRLLTLKNRPIEKGLIVLTADIRLIQPFLMNVVSTRRDEIVAGWKNTQTQATTWLFPLPNNLPTPIPRWITGGHDNLAIRVITHPLIAHICRTLVSDDNPYGFLVSTSCNPHGKPPATTLTQVQSYFGNHDDVVFVQGDTLGLVLPSQIRDAQTGHIIRI
ncbi:MAG: Sua5/YciO/YrdC/YwlC family protein [Moraxella sp.]|nr:Sua5/YciO/YrdC/YwlC family protein [Moraxella sp.]